MLSSSLFTSFDCIYTDPALSLFNYQSTITMMYSENFPVAGRLGPVSVAY
jgi:hypothetical protein